MNLQTMVDTLQEVRGPDRERLGGEPAVEGRGWGPVPSSASPPWSRGLAHLPRFGAGRAPPAHSCRKPGLRSPISVSATQACARGLGPRQGWWASCQVGSQPGGRSVAG